MSKNVQSSNIFFLFPQEESQPFLRMRSAGRTADTLRGSMLSLWCDLSPPRVSGLLPCSLLPPLGWSFPSSYGAVLSFVTCHLLSPCRHRPGLALPKILCQFPTHVLVFLKFPIGHFLKFLLVGLHPNHLDVFAALVLAPPTWRQPSSQLAVPAPFGQQQALCTHSDLSATWLCLAPHSADCALPSTEYRNITYPRVKSYLSWSGVSVCLSQIFWPPPPPYLSPLCLLASWTLGWDHGLTRGAGVCKAEVGPCRVLASR